MSIRGNVITETTEFFVEECGNCGIPFAFTTRYKNERLGDKRQFFCPNGHSQSYLGKSWQQQITALEAEKTALQSRVNSERERAAAAERAKERAKKEAERMEKRAAAGLCPYCNRSFAAARLQRHIHTKHPEKAHAENKG